MSREVSEFERPLVGQRRHQFQTSFMSWLQVVDLLPLLVKITIVLVPQCRLKNKRPS